MGARKMYEEQLMEIVKEISEINLPRFISMAASFKEEDKAQQLAASKGELNSNKAAPYFSEDFTERKKRKNAIYEICGKYAYIPTSSEEFAKRKEEEKKLDR